jgi:hypothetical protein
MELPQPTSIMLLADVGLICENKMLFIWLGGCTLLFKLILNSYYLLIIRTLLLSKKLENKTL